MRIEAAAKLPKGNVQTKAQIEQNIKKIFFMLFSSCNGFSLFIVKSQLKLAFQLIQQPLFYCIRPRVFLS